MVTGNGQAEIYMNRVQLKGVSRFKYSGATLYKDGSSMTDICDRITAAI